MRLPLLCFSVFFCVFLLHQPSHCQQEYLNNKQLQCDNASLVIGYECNGPQISCQSYVTFRAIPPYDSPNSIASLLGSTADEIAAINKVRNDETFPVDKLVIVPILCTCWGSFYLHYIASTFVVKKSDSPSFFLLSNNTYQGLTTCQRVQAQNDFVNQLNREEFRVMIPLLCACPSDNQTTNGVSSLLLYLVTWGDTISSIAEAFGVSQQSILEANKLTNQPLIFPFTPLLVPLKREDCKTQPKNFLCTIHGSKQFPARLVAIIGVSTGLGILGVILLGYRMFQLLKRRKNKILKEKLFKQNGGLLLQQRLLSYAVSERTKLFISEELQRATDNYNQSRILGRGGYGTVYKGMLPNGSIVAIKKSKAIDQTQIEQFVNEVVILSLVSHRNIVKLLGCCLETEVPLLVYEFIPKGTLSDHIHDQDQESSLSWPQRLRIASEVAGALAYMHSAAAFPIFHRDIKPSNILLDDNFCAKVSDFGTSRSVPYDKTHLTTAVQGTFGYLDPEYFQTSQFTEKSDVYSFGVVLMELLTGEKPFSLSRTQEERNYVAHFISYASQNKLLDVLDPRVARAASGEDIHAMANLAMRCLRLDGKDRPTMKEVSRELEELGNDQRRLMI